MEKFLAQLLSHLNLIPAISAAVQEFQAIGHTKETTVQKIGQIVQTSAALGEQIPVPLVQSISATVQTVADAVFAAPTPAATTTAAPAIQPAAPPSK